jgi:hypothetical protein
MVFLAAAQQPPDRTQLRSRRNRRQVRAGVAGPGGSRGSAVVSFTVSGTSDDCTLTATGGASTHSGSHRDGDNTAQITKKTQ